MPQTGSWRNSALIRLMVAWFVPAIYFRHAVGKRPSRTGQQDGPTAAWQGVFLGPAAAPLHAQYLNSRPKVMPWVQKSLWLKPKFGAAGPTSVKGA